MPLSVVPPQRFLRELPDRIRSISTEDENFSQRFVRLCREIIDDNQLFECVESVYCTVAPGLIAPFFETFGRFATEWFAKAEAVRTNLGCPDATSADAPSATEADDCQGDAETMDVLLCLKQLQCLRGMEFTLPPGMLLHPNPRVRYLVVTCSSQDAVNIAPDSSEMKEVRRVLSHGTEYPNGDSFPSLLSLLDEVLTLTAANATVPSGLIEQVWWSRHRLQVVGFYGQRAGQWQTQAAVEENNPFFTLGLMELCPHVPRLAMSPLEVVNGVVSDVFTVFEMGFLDFSLFSTPEVLRESWCNVQSLFGLRANGLPTFRSHGLMSYGVLRSLQYSGGFLTRHEPEAIAKEKVRILQSCNVDDPFGRFAYTISLNVAEYLSNGLFDAVVKLLHRCIKTILSECPREHFANGEVSNALFRRVQRVSVVVNIIDFIFQNASGHPNVSPVFLLSHRMAGGDAQEQELLFEMLELVDRAPAHFSILVHLITWCAKHNPRDVTHRLIEANIISRMHQTLQDHVGTLAAIPMNTIDGTMMHILCELLLQLVCDGLWVHNDGKALVLLHSEFMAKLLEFQSPTVLRGGWLRREIGTADEAFRLSLCAHIAARCDTISLGLLRLSIGLSKGLAAANVQRELDAIDRRATLPELVDFMTDFDVRLIPCLAKKYFACSLDEQQSALLCKSKPLADTMIVAVFGGRYAPDELSVVEAFAQQVIPTFRSDGSEDANIARLALAERILGGMFGFLGRSNDGAHCASMEAYIVAWIKELMLGGVAEPPSGDGETLLKSIMQLFLRSWGTASADVLSTEFVCSTLLGHPKISSCPHKWQIVSIASALLKKTATKIGAAGVRRMAIATNDEEGGGVDDNHTTSQRKRGRLGAKGPAKRRRNANSTQTSVADEEKLQAIDNEVQQLQTEFYAILRAIMPFTMNEAITADDTRATETIGSWQSGDPFLLGSSIEGLEEGMRTTVLGLFADKFAGIPLSTCSVPLQAVIFPFFQFIPTTGCALYRRLMEEVVVPMLADSVSDEVRTEPWLTPNRILNATSAALSFIHYHAWKEENGGDPGEDKAQKKVRLAHVATPEDELLMARMLLRVYEHAVAQETSSAEEDKGTLKNNRYTGLLGCFFMVASHVAVKLYGSDDEKVWVVCLRMARVLNKSHARESIAPSVARLFCDKPIVLHAFWRWAARRCFLRLRNAPAAASHHLQIPLSSLYFPSDSPVLDFGEHEQDSEACDFAMDADVFFAEMRRQVGVDVSIKCEEFMAWVRREIVVFKMPTTEPNTWRYFITLAKNKQVVHPQLLADVRETICDLASVDTALDCRILPALALFGRTTAAVAYPLPPKIITSAPRDEDEGGELQRATLPFAEELLLRVVDHLTKVIDSRPLSDVKNPSSEFRKNLSFLTTALEHIVFSLNCAPSSAFLRADPRANATLRRVLQDVTEHAMDYKADPSGVRTILYCIRVWVAGPLLARNTTPPLMLDALGNPVDEEEEVDGGDDDESSSDGGGSGGAVDLEPDGVANDGVQHDALGIKDALDAPREDPSAHEAPEKCICEAAAPFLSALIHVEANSNIRCPPKTAATPDVTPYHYCPPPTTTTENEALLYKSDVTVFDYVSSLAALLDEDAIVSREAFGNIALAVSETPHLRVVAVKSLVAEVDRVSSTRPAAVPMLLNACISIGSPLISGMRRSHDAMVVECLGENRTRCELLDSLLRALSWHPTFYKLKLVSLTMRLVAQTHVEPSPAANFECSWSNELPANEKAIPFHSHSLAYLSLGESEAPCFICRDVSYFYHYGCVTCRQFSCCLACAVQYCDPAVQFSCRRAQDRQTPVERTRDLLSAADDGTLRSILSSVLRLVSHPSFPCERSDGAMQLVEAIFMASRGEGRSEECVIALQKLAWSSMLPSTANMIAIRRKVLESLAPPPSEADDTQIMMYLSLADMSLQECVPGFYLHHLIPVVLEQQGTLSPDESPLVHQLLKDMASLVSLTMTLLTPHVAKIKNRDIAFSSSPANALFFAVTARALEALGPSADANFVTCSREDESMMLVRQESMSGCCPMVRTETQNMVADLNEPSIIFRQLVPDFKERQSHTTNEAVQCLSRIAIKHRSLLNHYIRNCESPSQILDAGLSCLVDATHLEFVVREKLFRSRLEEQSIERIEDVDVRISREHLLESSFPALVHIRQATRQGLVGVRVCFDEEESVDEGGVTREWVTLFFQALCKDGRLLRHVGDSYELNPGPLEIPGFQTRHLFEFLGVMVGLALTFNIPLEPHFTRALYKHMIGRQPTLPDLEASDPELFRSLMKVNKMTTDDDFEGLCQNFTVAGDDGKEVELCQNGTNTQVTNENKKQYIKLLGEYVMTTRVSKRIRALLLGVSRWFPLKWLTSFTAEEMELVCCGMSNIDVEDWRANTRYDGFTASSSQVRWFWDLVAVLAAEDRARLLQFIRGSAKVPAAGFSAVSPPFTISASASDNDRLPSSHTCYNQLDLPKYSSAEILREKLLQALEFGAIGFGFA